MCNYFHFKLIQRLIIILFESYKFFFKKIIIYSIFSIQIFQKKIKIAKKKKKNALHKLH